MLGIPSTQTQMEVASNHHLRSTPMARLKLSLDPCTILQPYNAATDSIINKFERSLSKVADASYEKRQIYCASLIARDGKLNALVMNHRVGTVYPDRFRANMTEFNGLDERVQPEPNKLRPAASSEELRKENERFKKEIEQLRQDIDRLFRTKDSDRSLPSTDGLPVPTCTASIRNSSTRPDDASSAATALSSHGNTDTFETSSPWPSPLAVSSLISMLRKYVGRNPDVDSIPTTPPSMNETLFITLPPPERLQALVNSFFFQFDCYFPLLDRVNFKKCVAEAFKNLSYSETNRRVSVGVQHYKTMAILCTVLAFGAPFLDPIDTPEPRAGWTQYLQGRQLIQSTEIPGDDDIDVVVYHTVSAAYLFHAEMLRAAQKHIVQAFQAAQVARLNDQQTWNDGRPNMAFPRSLWWNLYFLDKRITQKSGVAYFIRESEVAVDDFSKHYISRWFQEVDAEHQDFIQTMILYSRLWTRTWDSFFAPRSINAKNWEEVLIMDARVMIAERHVAPQLRWKTDQFEELVRKGEEEYRVRRRLLVYTRFQELRLTIRQESLPDKEIDYQRRRSCFHIAKDIVDAVEKYLNKFPANRAAEYMITSTLVKAIYYIVPESRDENTPLDIEMVRGTLRLASTLLKSLVNNVAAANRAYQALRCVLLIDEEEAARSSAREEDALQAQNGIGETTKTQCDSEEGTACEVPKLPQELWNHPLQFPSMSASSLEHVTAQMMESNTYMIDESQAFSQPYTTNAMAYNFPSSSAGNLNFGLGPPSSSISNGSFFNLDVGWEVNELQRHQVAPDFDWNNIQFNI
ncbi:hypothetical protein NA57DRAFT_62398 [Rhizodiscina lignyota]|uniref:Xylanolytic transcriptional activator regulatory domain-containing protein n=1 Tax=Rhizodiscina lignyota TaxID=1504668 RepID=A0A9P4M457_9PEZI|nr:hypothetical protein NA57DRAFT_62398 [Rhizodiscina lignyota]